jgi:hypothetical protein
VVTMMAMAMAMAMVMVLSDEGLNIICMSINVSLYQAVQLYKHFRIRDSQHSRVQ